MRRNEYNSPWVRVVSMRPVRILSDSNEDGPCAKIKDPTIKNSRSARRSEWDDDDMD